MTTKPGCMGVDHRSHDFHPRYDYKEPDPMSTFFSMKKEDIKKDKIYVYDVCVQCGTVIERKQR